MPATSASGPFTGITRGDAFIDMMRRVASGAVAPMGRSCRNRGRPQNMRFTISTTMPV
jgi:hypothetical protein